jgi:hypothetical protein
MEILVNVDWFGARGDGTAFDAPAIQRAIDATGWPSKSGGIIFSPGKKYLVAGSSGNGQTLLLNGSSSAGPTTPPFSITGYGSELQAPAAGMGTAGAMLKIFLTPNPPNNVVTQVVVSGLYFATRSAADTAIHMEYAYHCEITDCVFFGGQATAIKLNGPNQHARIHSCQFGHIGTAIHAISNGTSAPVGRTSMLSIVGCNFSEDIVDQGIFIDGEENPTNVVISACNFRGAGATNPAITLKRGESVSISGCSFGDCPFPAIKVELPCRAVSINGCTFRSCSQDAVLLEGSSRVSVTGNAFDSVGTSGSQYSGVFLQGAASRNVVSGNTFSAIAGAYSVKEDSSATSNVVTSNVADGGLGYFQNGANGSQFANNIP